MRNFITLLFLFTQICCGAQHVYKSKEGHVRFFSDAPLEDIEATTTKASAAYNVQTGEIATIVPIKSFTFEKALMQEHFNENYLESAKYPNASFKGKISTPIIPEPGAVKNVEAEGELNVHGVTQKRTIPVQLKFLTDGKIEVISTFNVKLVDHKIDVPKIVFQNIAEVVEVSLDFNLSPPNEK